MLHGTRNRNPNQNVNIFTNKKGKAMNRLTTIVAMLVMAILTLGFTPNANAADDCQPNAELLRLSGLFNGLTDKAAKCAFVKSADYKKALRESNCSVKDMAGKTVDQLCGASNSAPGNNAASAEQALYQKWFVPHAPVPLYFLKAWPFDDKLSDYATGQDAKVKAGLSTLEGRAFRGRQFNLPKSIVGGLDPMPGAIERYLAAKKTRDKNYAFYKATKKRLKEIADAERCTSAPFVPPEASKLIADLELLIPRFNRRNPTQEFGGNTLDKQMAEQMLAVAKKRLARLQTESIEWTCPDPAKKGIEDFGKLVKKQLNASNSPDKADGLKLVEAGEKDTSPRSKLLWFSSAAELLPPKLLAASRGFCPDCPKGGDGPCNGSGRADLVGIRLITSTKLQWIPPLHFGVYTSFHTGSSVSTRSGIDYSVSAQGYEVGADLAYEYAWIMNKNNSLLVGANLFLGYRHTNFHDETWDSGKYMESKGFTIGMGAKLGWNLYNWVTLGVMGNGRFLPGGYSVGGFADVDGLSIVRIHLAVGHQFANNNANLNLTGASPADYSGLFVTTSLKVVF